MIHRPIVIRIPKPTTSLIKFALDKCKLVIAQHKIVLIVNTDDFVSAQHKILGMVKADWPHISIVFTGPSIGSKKLMALFKSGLDDYFLSGSDKFYLELAIIKIRLKIMSKKFDPFEYNLTQREAQVLSFLVDGHTSKDIANLIHLSPATIKVHKSRLMQKLNASTLPDLVRITEA